SNGTTPGSAVVWVVNVDGPTGANGRLCAYQAVPVDNHLNLLRCFPVGTGAKFTTPAPSNGRIYVGTRDGYVYGFGHTTPAALAPPQTSFGDVAVSTSATRTVTATATRTITVNAVATTGAPFTAGTPDRALPVVLNAGDKINVPVTFAPTVPGSITGALTFTIIEA